MQWEKLERSFQALEGTLHALGANDRFNVLVFNSDVSTAFSNLVAGTPENVAHALEFVTGSRLKGGTNLQKAFEAALRQAPDDAYVVLLSDGGVSEGIISPLHFAEWYKRAWSGSKKPHTYVLGIGDDANSRLLRQLAAYDGVFEQIGSTEPLEFKLNGFIHKLGLAPLSSVNLNVSPNVEPSLIYRAEEDNFPGARASWVGRYRKPGDAEVRIAGESARVKLPVNETDHPYLPAAWARARVDALLEKIDREGENKASIDEIVALSRKYHFVTPYTSFLAAPRALLRPRLIRPGDPLLRVRTDPSIKSVVALFPFGLVKPLRYLRSEDIWQTRFIAPANMTDGVHTVRLVLRDRAGHTYCEQKTFLIASHPPIVRVRLPASAVHVGSRVPIRVQASQNTRTIAVRLYGAPPLLLRWNEAEKANTGVLNIPPGFPAGHYAVHVTAEDMAHNVSQQEVPLEIVP
jgi:Ca-activated chloride channel family protein